MPQRPLWVMEVRDVVKAIEANGWYLVRQRGSHRHFQHITNKGTVTVAGHPSDEVAAKTLSTNWRQAGMKGGRR